MRELLAPHSVLHNLIIVNEPVNYIQIFISFYINVLQEAFFKYALTCADEIKAQTGVLLFIIDLCCEQKCYYIEFKYNKFLYIQFYFVLELYFKLNHTI